MAPVSGEYKLECWGAQGGWAGYNSTVFVYGGKGGYSKGFCDVLVNTIFFVVVGGVGHENTYLNNGVSGGYNGGGRSYGWVSTMNGGGGGATHIASVSGLLATISLENIYIVAGGGGGSACDRNHGITLGGYGGGEVGGNGNNSPNSDGYYGLGGTQNAGGSYRVCPSNWSGTVAPSIGKLGIGGNGATNGGAGAGAGLFGGGGAAIWGGAGGGSGFVNSSLLTNAQTTGGNEAFPSVNGETETGHAGNGTSIITWIAW